MHKVRFLDDAGSVRHGRWADGKAGFAGHEYEAGEIEILPPCDPTKIVCVGLNYSVHAEEVDAEIPERPLLFLKPPSALSGHGDTVTLPIEGNRFDFEAELAVIMAEQCRDVEREEAMGYVEGFTCGIDISNRDDQRKEQNWVRGKAFDNASPLGPAVASPDEVGSDAYIRCRVNGEMRQDSSRDQLIFTVPEIIEEITRYMTLEVGDVILTGTPSGVGSLSDGDTVEVDIEGIPVLRSHISVP